MIIAILWLIFNKQFQIKFTRKVKLFIKKKIKIEKLKRSVNEITIISKLYALINLLIRNIFFIKKEKSKYNEILNDIFQ